MTAGNRHLELGAEIQNPMAGVAACDRSALASVTTALSSTLTVLERAPLTESDMAMKNSARWMFAGLALLTAGCAGDDDEGDTAGEMIASSQGSALIIYSDPYAPMMAGMANPIPTTARATALAFDVEGKLRLQLEVEGFTPSRVFGSHLHKLACTDDKAGGHYQNDPVPMGGMATDPAFANRTNEAWLDFETDAAGAGAVELTLDWLPRAGEAQSIIFHHMASGTGGVSGAKLACLPIAF
jgi:hypothetical protein